MGVWEGSWPTVSLQHPTASLRPPTPTAASTPYRPLYGLVRRPQSPPNPYSGLSNPYPDLRFPTVPYGIGFLRLFTPFVRLFLPFLRPVFWGLQGPNRRIGTAKHPLKRIWKDMPPASRNTQSLGASHVGNCRTNPSIIPQIVTIVHLAEQVLDALPTVNLGYDGEGI